MTSKYQHTQQVEQKMERLNLPLVFSTPYRKELIHKAFTNLNSHKFQPQGRHPTAGMDVVADSNDPPTGQGVSRVARARGGGGGRQGQGCRSCINKRRKTSSPTNCRESNLQKIKQKRKKTSTLFSNCCNSIKRTCRIKRT